MKAIQQKNQHFIEAVYSRYKVPLLCVIRKYIGSKDDCEDIFQEVIVRIIKNAELLIRLPQPKLEAYIFLIARGVSIDYLRTLNRKAEICLENDIVLDVLSRKNRQATTCPDSIRKADLFMMMEKMPADEKILLIGKYYLGLSINELNELVGGSQSALRSKIFRARKKLLEEWAQEGLILEDFLDE